MMALHLLAQGISASRQVRQTAPQYARELVLLDELPLAAQPANLRNVA